MLTAINPKLPMRNKEATKEFYIVKLGFTEIADYGDYIILKKDSIEIHFFLFKDLDPLNNYGQVYIRTNKIQNVYQELLGLQIPIHPNGHLETKPWGQIEFSLIDPDYNLLTFGQGL